MAGYIGANTSSVTNNQNAAERRKKFTFTAATTVLSGLNFAPQKIHIFHNGIRLVRTTDYTEASDGKSVTLVNAAQAGDEVVAVTFAQDPASNPDVVPASTGGTFSDAVTIDSDGATALTVDRATSDGTVIDVQKNGTTVGSIGTEGGDLVIGTGDTGIKTHDAVDAVIPYNTTTNSARDDAIDLGFSTNRFQDLYLSGGVFLGGTGAANKLDDFEEGTFTPSMTFGGSSSGVTYGSREGIYTKVGRFVSGAIRIQLTNNGSGVGNAIITGLPFTVDDALSTTAVQGGFPLVFVAGVAGTQYAFHAHPWESTTNMDIYRTATTDGSSQSRATNSQVGNTFDMRLSFFYVTT